MNDGFEASCSVYGISKITSTSEQQIRILRDSASFQLRKMKSTEKRDETLSQFFKEIETIFNDASKEMAKLVGINVKDLIHFASNADEIVGDLPEDVECALAEVRTLRMIQMAAFRKISNQVFSQQNS